MVSCGCGFRGTDFAAAHCLSGPNGAPVGVEFGEE